MPTIWGRPQVPRDVSRMTPSRLTGSGPKKLAKTPGVVATLSSVTLARPSSALIRPPWLFRTATITATMPNSMIRPWMKSLTAVAM